MAMVELKRAGPEDWEVIRSIAYNTWPNTFGSVIPKEQLEYMLALIYSEQSLKDQMLNRDHNFILPLKEEIPVGFASYELNYRNNPHLMLHKLYLLPEVQGMGIGRLIFSYLEDVAKTNANDTIRLKVFHKNDTAIAFYKRNGFSIIDIEITDTGNGYLITDNVMTKKI